MAVTVTGNDVPAVAVLGALTARLVAGPAVIVKLRLVPEVMPVPGGVGSFGSPAAVKS